jgi:hypothetical protein
VKGLLQVLLWGSAIVGVWYLIRGWRRPVDPYIVAISFAVFGAAGPAIDGNAAQAVGQSVTMVLVATTTLWATKRGDGRRGHPVVTQTQVRLLWVAFVLRIAAVAVGAVAFVLWVLEGGTVLGRTLLTALVGLMVATSVMLDYRGRPRAYLS